MTLADFNNDGRLDLFVGSYHGAKERDIDSYIYWNRAGRGFSATDRTRLFTHSASGVIAADFNEDGWVDLAIAYHKVWGDHVGYSAVWWNGPDGFDERRVTVLPTSGPHGMISVEPRNASDGGDAEFYTSRAYTAAGGQPGHADRVAGRSARQDLGAGAVALRGDRGGPCRGAVAGRAGRRELVRER